MHADAAAAAAAFFFVSRGITMTRLDRSAAPALHPRRGICVRLSANDDDDVFLLQRASA
jgi:hypothetical protein